MSVSIYMHSNKICQSLMVLNIECSFTKISTCTACKGYVNIDKNMRLKSPKKKRTSRERKKCFYRHMNNSLEGCVTGGESGITPPQRYHIRILSFSRLLRFINGNAEKLETFWQLAQIHCAQTLWCPEYQ